MKYVVKLGAEERKRLERLIRSGKHPAQRVAKARILLKADSRNCQCRFKEPHGVTDDDFPLRPCGQSGSDTTTARAMRVLYFALSVGP
jgi:hypothetical protein